MSVARRADDVIAVAPDEVRARKRKLGPLLPVASFAICAGILGYLIATRGFVLPTFVVALQVLTKVSFLIFVLVFATRPLHDLFQSRATAWLLANRRYTGLSFAVWHLMHWPILGSMLYIVGPEKFMKFFGGIVVPAGSVLVVISLLALTSNNASRRLLGKRGWSVLHTLGIYIIWGWFFKVYVLSKMPRIAAFEDKPYVFVYVGLLFAALLLRLLMAGRRLVQR